MSATAFIKLLKQHDFKEVKGMPTGMRGFNYLGTPTIWCEVYTDKPWPYAWIVGNKAKDTTRYPGGKMIDTLDELKEYLDPIKPANSEAR